LNGVIQTCPGINQNFGLATFLKVGKCHYLLNNILSNVSRGHLDIDILHKGHFVY
jgi:hypothetical protein